MDRKELIAILLLGAVVLIAATVRLYHMPVHNPGPGGRAPAVGKSRKSTDPEPASLPNPRYPPKDVNAQLLLEAAEGVFGYALFAAAVDRTGKEPLFQDAIRKYELFRELYPRERAAELALLRIAQCYTVEGKFAEASRAYDRLLDVYPRSELRPMALLWSGEAHLRIGKPEVARDRFAEVARDYPGTQFGEAGNSRLGSLPKDNVPAPTKTPTTRTPG